MNTSCIRHPEKNHYLQIHAWQMELCKDNPCAGLLLAFFCGWHDWKLANDEYYRRANDIAEIHGDGRPHNENAYLFFNTDELMKGCMHLYGKNAIKDGLQYLASLGAISIHPNPKRRYHFDKTKYFIFYPEVCNEWLLAQYPVQKKQRKVSDLDPSKMSDRDIKINLSSHENDRPSAENVRHIKNYTTNNTTNNTTAASDILTNPSLLNIDTNDAADLLIGEKLTSSQQIEVNKTADKLKHHCKTSTNLAEEITFAVLSLKCFTQCGDDFFKKLNAIKKTIREGKWRKPAGMILPPDKLPVVKTPEEKRIEVLESERASLRYELQYSNMNTDPKMQLIWRNKIEVITNELKDLYAQLKKAKISLPQTVANTKQGNIQDYNNI